MSTDETALRERLAGHSVAGSNMPRQGAGQTIPELLVLCFSCGWMRAGEYDAHLADIVAQEVAAARAEAKVPAVYVADDHEECDTAIRAAKSKGIEAGYAQGRAEVVAKVEAVTRWSVPPGYAGIIVQRECRPGTPVAMVRVDDLRAALDEGEGR